MYLFGSKLLKNKFLYLALILIFGINKSLSIFIVKKLGFSFNFKVKNLFKKQMNNLIKTMKSLNIFLASDLKKFRFFNFKKLIKLKSVKGFKKLKGLPVRGQRTKTNGKTAKKIFLK
jgi:small subunit ribosomal protein S13